MAIWPDTHGARSPAHISPTRARHGHDSRAVPGPHCQPMDASRHGPKKGGPIGPMGSTIGPFKYYVIHYQTQFKHFRAAGLPGQTGRPGPIKSISGHAWAGTSAHGQARHGPIIFSCLSGSCLNGPCLDGSVPGRTGPPVWPPIDVGISLIDNIQLATRCSVLIR